MSYEYFTDETLGISQVIYENDEGLSFLAQTNSENFNDQDSLEKHLRELVQSYEQEFYKYRSN